MFQNLQPDIKRQRKFRLITLLISIIGICFVLEIFGHFRLQFALKKELSSEVMKKMIDWVDYFHHHRDAV
jgi:Na+/melibiose symporter-like transporter